MITTRLLSQTLAVWPNSRLNTPMVPGPHTSCVMSTSAFTQMLSPACTEDLPAARARIFSVNVINSKSVRSLAVSLRFLQSLFNRHDVQRVDANFVTFLVEHDDQPRAWRHPHEVWMNH